MELLQGITGFRHVDEPPRPLCDSSEFKSDCYAAARTFGGTLLSFDSPACHGVANYSEAILQLSDRSVAVVLNLYYPFLAFADPSELRTLELKFIDDPKLAEFYRAFEAYDVFAYSELIAPVTKDACRNLGPAELQQIQYWNPKSIGDLVFNYWD